MYYSKGKNIKNITKATGHNYRTIIKYLEKHKIIAINNRQIKGNNDVFFQRVNPVCAGLL
jgi:hypothetical protein